MKKILTPVLSLFAFLLPLQTFACLDSRSLMERVLPPYILIACIVLLGLVVFLRVRKVEKYSKIVTGTLIALVVILISFFVFENSKKDTNDLGVKDANSLCGSFFNIF